MLQKFGRSCAELRNCVQPFNDAIAKFHDRNPLLGKRVFAHRLTDGGTTAEYEQWRDLDDVDKFFE